MEAESVPEAAAETAPVATETPVADSEATPVAQ